jgi:hypothetical protein
VRAAAAVFVLAGIVLGVVRQIGASPAEANVEGVVASVAYAVAIAMPGIVALVGHRGLVTIAAGFAGMAVAVVASFGATLPLVFPAVALIARGMRDLRRPDDVLRALAIACLLPWAAVVLYAHGDPAEWDNGMVSDVVVWWESLVSLGLSALALLAGGSRPRANHGKDVVGVGTGADQRRRRRRHAA